jgi:hypothetical protein
MLFGLTPNGKPAGNRVMKTNRFFLIAVTLWLAAAATATFAASPFLGTWKLNQAKSKFAPGSTKNTTVTYTAAARDMMKVTVDGIDKDGKPVHWTWTGRFDGKSYKVKGNSSVDALALKQVNERTNDLTGGKDGKVVMTGRIVVAKDGKSRVVTTTTKDAKGNKHTDKAYYTKG